MTSLNTHIPVKYIRQNKKLQKIFKLKADDYCPDCGEQLGYDNETKILFCPKCPLMESDKGGNIKITIADIITDAELLFDTGKELVEMMPNEIAQEILIMCQQDKPIEKISEYILKNIK